MSFHRDQVGADVHVIHAFTYADAAARTGASGFDVGDVGKVALQSNNSTFWVLTSTAPTWTELTGAGGGSGEANTASNVNTAGVGVFKQKTGVDLEFRGLNAASNRVAVTLDGPNNEIDLDVNEANLDIGAQSGTITDGQHGSRGGGSLHALASAGVSDGFMSAADKSKLDGFAGEGEYIRRDGSVPFTGSQSLADHDLTAVRLATRTVLSHGNQAGPGFNFDLSAASVHTVTLTGDVAATFTAPPAGTSFMIIVTQDATAGRNLTLPSGHRTTNGTQPNLGAQSGDVNVLAGFYDGATYIWDTSGNKRAI